MINEWIKNAKAYPVGLSFEDLIARYGFKEEEILRLAGNELTVTPSRAVINSAEQALSSSNYYAEPFSESLVKKISERFAARGVDMTKANLMVGNGMDSVMEHIAALCLNSHSSILNFPPSFAFYDSLTEKYGAEMISVARNPEDFSIDFTAALKALRTDTRLCFLCSPNNPTANSSPVEEIRDFAAELEKRNVILFLDQAYIEFSEQEDLASLAAEYKNIVIGYTFSKAYAMAGMRVGYALISAEIYKELQKILTPFLCSKASLAAAATALDEAALLTQRVTAMKEQRQFLCDEFDKLGLVYFPSDANFILCRSKIKTAKLSEALLEKGIIVRAMPKIDEYSFRVTVPMHSEQSYRFISALVAALEA